MNAFLAYQMQTRLNAGRLQTHTTFIVFGLQNTSILKRKKGFSSSIQKYDICRIPGKRGVCHDGWYIAAKT